MSTQPLWMIYADHLHRSSMRDRSHKHRRLKKKVYWMDNIYKTICFFELYQSIIFDLAALMVLYFKILWSHMQNCLKNKTMDAIKAIEKWKFWSFLEFVELQKVKYLQSHNVIWAALPALIIFSKNIFL